MACSDSFSVPPDIQSQEGISIQKQAWSLWFLGVMLELYLALAIEFGGENPFENRNYELIISSQGAENFY